MIAISYVLFYKQIVKYLLIVLVFVFNVLSMLQDKIFEISAIAGTDCLNLIKYSDRIVAQAGSTSGMEANEIGPDDTQCDS